MQSFTFVHADLEDNKKLLEEDPRYGARLKSLPVSQRAKMLDGNWNARAARGDYFQRTFFKCLPESRVEMALGKFPDPNKHTIKLVRCYDFAATPVQGNTIPGIERPDGYKPRAPGTKADWTASVLLAECAPPKATRNVGPRYVLLDAQRWQDTPGAVRQWVVRQAQIDGPQTRVALFRDPGQAGLDQLEQYKRALAQVGATMYTLPTIAPGTKPSGGTAKQMNARGASQAVFDNRFYYSHLIPQDRLAAFFSELESFPDADKPPSERAADDQVDAFTGAFRALHEIPSSSWGLGAYSPTYSTTHQAQGSDYWLGRSPRDTDREYELRPGGTVGFEKGF